MKEVSHKFLFGSGSLSQSQHAPACVCVAVFLTLPPLLKEVPRPGKLDEVHGHSHLSTLGKLL